MRRGLLNILVLLALLAAAGAAADEAPLMPAPVDRPSMRYDEQKGATVRRNKWGIMDPTPQVKPLEYLPKDRYGFVDWARALKEGLIKPKDALPGSPAPPPPAFDEDVLIKAKLKFMPDVIFPHSTHNQWLSCAPCHPKMFSKKAGASGISMIAIWKGRYCGRCHDRVAFPIRNCFRCHSVKNVDERRKARRDEMAEFRKSRPPFTKPADKDKIGKRRFRFPWPL